MICILLSGNLNVSILFLAFSFYKNKKIFWNIKNVYKLYNIFVRLCVLSSIYLSIYLQNVFTHLTFEIILYHFVFILQK